MVNYTFSDGVFTLHTAQYGSWQNDARVVFRVRVGRDPHQRAAEKGIKYYDRIVPASECEVGVWLKTHPAYPVKEAACTQ